MSPYKLEIMVIYILCVAKGMLLTLFVTERGSQWMSIMCSHGRAVTEDISPDRFYKGV